MGKKKLIDQFVTAWTDHVDQGGGDGPFKGQSYSHSVGLTVVANSNYYGPQPKLQKIEFNQSGDTDTTFKAFEAGQFDYASVPPASLATVRADSKMSKELHDNPLLVIRYLSMNYLAKPFDNIKNR